MATHVQTLACFHGPGSEIFSSQVWLCVGLAGRCRCGCGFQALSWKSHNNHLKRHQVCTLTSRCCPILKCSMCCPHRPMACTSCGSDARVRRLPSPPGRHAPHDRRKSFKLLNTSYTFPSEPPPGHKLSNAFTPNTKWQRTCKLLNALIPNGGRQLQDVVEPPVRLRPSSCEFVSSGSRSQSPC